MAKEITALSSYHLSKSSSEPRQDLQMPTVFGYSFNWEKNLYP